MNEIPVPQCTPTQKNAGYGNNKARKPRTNQGTDRKTFG